MSEADREQRSDPADSTADGGPNPRAENGRAQRGYPTFEPPGPGHATAGTGGTSDDWLFASSDGPADLPALREVTAPTETNFAEQVTPPLPSYGSRADGPSAPATGEATHEPERSAGPDAAERPAPPREEEPGAVTPLWSRVSAGAEHAPPVGPDTTRDPLADRSAAPQGPDSGAAATRRGRPRFSPPVLPPADPTPGSSRPGPYAAHPYPGSDARPPEPSGYPLAHDPATGALAPAPTGHPVQGPRPPGHGPGYGVGGHAHPGTPAPQRLSGAAADSPGAACGDPRSGALAAHSGNVRFLPPAVPGPPNGMPHPPPPPPAAARAPRQDEDDDVTRGSHRPHWATVPFQVLLVSLVFIAVPGPLLIGVGPGLMLLSTLAVAFGATVYALLSWWNSSFGLRADHLVVHSGVVRRASREVPLSRLQAVDVVRPLLMQILGLAELRIELAGGDASCVRLRYLSRRTAERLRASLLAHAAGLSGTTPEAPEWPLYRLPFGLLLGALAFRLPVLGAFVLFLALMAAGVSRGEPGVLGAAIPLLLGLMQGFIGPLLRYTDFYASRSPDGLRLRYGIFQARMQTVPPGRVQAVRIVEPLLWRALGVVRVDANVAGYVGERQMDSSTLFPVVPRPVAYALVGEIFPGADAARVALRPARRSGAAHDALGIDDRLFVSRRGIVCRVTEIVPHARVQSVRLTAGPISRWRGVADVDADTPPGPIRARAVGRDLAEARRVVDGVAERGHAARATAAGPERWATRSEGPGPAA
ncbi:PH domain-containing protein [Nocardiopsis rhodophaea]|uniref:PH domain-containing protein n=1 Tax=Nocardiopsis rhodophaea TaxID=280238 RepID=UPI0031D4E0C4